MQTVVFSCDEFDILNECAYYEQVYKQLGMRMDERLFAINGPFLMDSQFDAMKKEGRRVRKRKKPNTVAVESSNEAATVEKIARRVREAGFSVGFFSIQAERDNNRFARCAARELMERKIQMYTPQAIVTNEIITMDDNSSLPHICRKFVVEDEFCMLNSWYRNDSDSCIRMNVSKSANEPPSVYYVPPKATFHVGCVSDVRNFTAINGEMFDLIIMDPPWENHSVKRQKSYVMDESILSQIEMDSLAPDGLLAVWITNREGIQHHLAAHFLRWGLERLATIFWLKVTLEGEPVCSFNVFRKVPYERLVLAARAQYVARYESASAADGKVIASVPMALPSRKPPVVPILRSLGVQPKWCLELFARSLQPNTVSVGFEPLLLQSASCFIPSEATVV